MSANWWLRSRGDLYQIESAIPGSANRFLDAQHAELLALFASHGQLSPDWNDEVVIGVTLAREGLMNHAATAEALGVAHVAITPAVKENA